MNNIQSHAIRRMLDDGKPTAAGWHAATQRIPLDDALAIVPAQHHVQFTKGWRNCNTLIVESESPFPDMRVFWNAGE